MFEDYGMNANVFSCCSVSGFPGFLAECGHFLAVSGDIASRHVGFPIVDENNIQSCVFTHQIVTGFTQPLTFPRCQRRHTISSSCV